MSVDLNAIASRRVVYRMAGMDEVTVRRDVAYRAADGTEQPIEIYYPPAPEAGRPTPAVLMATGFADAGMRRFFARNAKDLGSNVSWARLIAASGMAAIAYVNVDPVRDAAAVLDDIRAGAGSLGVDAERVGVWASSGNVPNALGLLMERRECIRCAALLYGYTLDLDGSTAVAETAATFGFTNPAAGRSVADLPVDLPLFLARAGADEMPRLNESLDRFVARALAHNLPLVFANHPRGAHAFDAVDDSDTSRVIVAQVLSFLRAQLLGHTRV